MKKLKPTASYVRSICSQMNSFTPKLPFMKKLKSYFRILCKSSSDTEDLWTQPQTLCRKLTQKNVRFTNIIFVKSDEFIYFAKVI